MPPEHAHAPKPVVARRSPLRTVTPACPDRTSTRDGVVGLQRAAGNRAVTGWFDAARLPIQRVKVDGAFEENLLQPYDARNRPTRALTPHVYAQDVHYDITRAPDKVNVEVKIRFIAPDGTAIPAADAARRDYIASMCTGIGGAWNGKYEFVGKPKPPPPPPAPAPVTPAPAGGVPPAPATAPPPPVPVVEIRLPVAFKATPEYAAADDGSMPVVRIHPATVAADSTTPGKRIDSGNWFMNLGDYDTGDPQEQVKTAAHEYGHLLGIPDEYSQSNAQIHALMHQASPTITAGQDQALDDAATKFMVLRAMSPALMRHVRAGSVKATQAIGAKRADLERELRAAIAGLWSDPSVTTPLTVRIGIQLLASGHAELIPKVAAGLAHQGAGLDTGAIARAAVRSQIGGGQIRSLMESSLRTAIMGAQRVTIPITNASGQAQSMIVDIGTSKAVNSAAAGGPLSVAAEKVAAATMDKPAGRGGAPPPALRPSGSFLSELQALTGTWATGNTLATQAGAMKGKVVDEYNLFGLDAAAATDEAKLAVFLRGAVQTMSSSLGGEAVNTYLSSTFATMMQGQIDAITSSVQTEIDAHRTATATGTSASAPGAPDPRVTRAVAQMSAKMRAMQAQAGTAVPGAKMTGAAAAPTTQHTEFTVRSMMGAGNEGGMRIDYLTKMLDQFNTNLKKVDEELFKTVSK